MVYLQYNAYGGYYSLLFIPIGLAFYCMIKVFSDLSVSHKGLVINSAGTFQEHAVTATQILREIEIVQAFNDSQFAITGLPIRFGDICMLQSAAGEHAGSQKYEYFCIALEWEGRVVRQNDMLLCDYTGDYWKDFAARYVYDNFVLHGAFNAKTVFNAQKFTLKNTMLQLDDFNIETLNRPDMSLIAIGNSKELQKKIRRNCKRIGSHMNARMMLLSVNGFLGVMEC